MDRVTSKAWTEAARHVLASIPRNFEAEERDEALNHFEPEQFGRCVAAVRGRIPHSGATLAAVTRAASEMLCPWRETDPAGLLQRPEARAVRAIVVGYAFATYGGNMLHPHERADALDALQGLRASGIDADVRMSSMGRAAASADDPGTPARGPGPVPFRFTWQQRGRNGQPTRNVAGMGQTILRGVAAAAAPVVARLATPTGGRLELRCLDGVLYRPVLSPGSWDPIGIDAFAAAAEDGVPWRDNPFAPRHRSPFGPVQGAAETWRTEGDAMTRDDVARRSEALATCLGLAGGLAVIDGVVHRETEPPRLVVALRTAAPRAPGRDQAGPHLAWAFRDGPRSDASQSTLAPFSNFPLGACMAPWLPEDEAGMAVSFPAGAAAAAETFLEGLLPALEHWHGKAFARPSSPVEIVDGDAFPDHGEAVGEALAEVRRILDDRNSGMPADTPYFDEAEALSPEDPDDLRVPPKWRETTAERPSRTAIGVVAALARASRILDAASPAGWSDFSP